MNEILARNVYFVKEHTGILKAANNYDILDPTNGQVIMECREDKLGKFTKLLRFTKWKRNTPFHVEIRTPNGRPVLTVKRGVSFFLSMVEVYNEQNQFIGGFKEKIFSIGGAFTVLDAHGKPVCTLKGKWTSWDFRFFYGDVELAHITKKWAGLGKELFTSADNYVLEISPNIPSDSAARQLILAAVMCSDMVLKE